MEESGYNRPYDSGQGRGFDPKKTVNENLVFPQQDQQQSGSDMQNCNYCGYPVMPGMNNCPNCGKGANRSQQENRRTTRESELICSHCKTSLNPGFAFCPSCGKPQQENQASQSGSKKNQIGRQTIRPGKRSHCTLTLIPEEKEHIAQTTLSFSGDEIILNRENTDPENITITSKEQAILVYENKRWYIQDRSELKTTYIQAAEKVEINPGDIILLGDRQFEFDY